MKAYEKLLSRFYEIDALDSAMGLMSWDRQVLMPIGGGPARTKQTAALARLSHELLISDETQRLAENAAAEVEAGTAEAALLRVVKRELEIETKFPTPLVEEKSRTSSEAYEIWRGARAESDFSRLAPYLEKLFDVARKFADLRGYTDHIYDPLIDLYEEGATYKSAKAMFDAIKGPIKEIVAVAAARNVDDSFLYGDWDSEMLLAFTQRVATEIGFDFSRGRFDLTTNAFCGGPSKDDIRMTARPGSHIGAVLFSALHEMGHGLYEQNSPSAWDRTPLKGGISLGVHESQSRTWENIVGRSMGLWKRFYPELQREFPALKGHSLDEFYLAINKVEPGPIRIGSDELTYNFHILVRFELETEILTGQVRIKDLPEAWNEKYRNYLGIVPKNDAEGCLQDVHWSRGSVGYFPTYSMGNMMSWQIWHSLEQDVPDTEGKMAAGEFKPILGWLTEKVYSQAKRYTPSDLMTRVTGRPMGPDDYIKGMRGKFGA
ncbi:MAG TPA: carboxypeptidase M32 [Fimbriimonadaceae bacterium]|jgi:carboxypeptidase Taq